MGGVSLREQAVLAGCRRRVAERGLLLLRRSRVSRAVPVRLCLLLPPRGVPVGHRLRRGQEDWVRNVRDRRYGRTRVRRLLQGGFVLLSADRALRLVPLPPFSAFFPTSSITPPSPPGGRLKPPSLTTPFLCSRNTTVGGRGQHIDPVLEDLPTSMATVRRTASPGAAASPVGQRAPRRRYTASCVCGDTCRTRTARSDPRSSSAAPSPPTPPRALEDRTSAPTRPTAPPRPTLTGEPASAAVAPRVGSIPCAAQTASAVGRRRFAQP